MLSFYLFLILSSFFIYLHFFDIFFPFVLQMSSDHGLHLHVIIFSFISTSLLQILREERQDHPIYRKNSSPFCLCCCVIVGPELDNLLYFFPLSHPYHFTDNPTLYPNSFYGSPHTHPPRGPWEEDSPEPQEVLRYTYF